MAKDLIRSLRFTLVTLVLFGGGYNAAVWAVGRAFFPVQAEGNLIRRADGTIVGSGLIAQRFTRLEYFRSRPSGVDYDAAATGGTNAGPSNPAHLDAVRQRLAAVVAEEGVAASHVPSEMVTASGGGLDPHISPAAAGIQVARVARARRVGEDRVRELVRRHTEPPVFGFLGRPRVNVLVLNLALDSAFGTPAPAVGR